MSAPTPALESEAAVLGATMERPLWCSQAVARLAAGDFTREAHRVLYATIVDVWRKTGTIDPAAVNIALADAGKLEVVGGATVVHQLSSSSYTIAFDHHVDRILDHALRARVYAAAVKLASAASDPSVPADSLTGQAVDLLLEAHLGDEQRMGVVTGRQLADDVRTAYDTGGRPQGESTGWAALDEFYRPRKGRWTVVGGIPGHGKSSLVDALTVNLARLHGWRVAFCSPEKLPIAEHAADLARIYIGAPVYHGPSPRMTRQDLDRALEWVDEHFVWVMPDERSRQVSSVLGLASLLHRTAPLDGLVIDPWNELDHQRPAGLTETEHISRELTRIREWARGNDVHVWVVAHPTKLQKGTDGKYPVPTPYDLAGSAHWRNKADNAFAVWRDTAKPNAPTQVHVQKVRWQPQEGQLGMAELQFRPMSLRFIEPEPVRRAM